MIRVNHKPLRGPAEDGIPLTRRLRYNARGEGGVDAVCWMLSALLTQLHAQGVLDLAAIAAIANVDVKDVFVEADAPVKVDAAPARLTDLDAFTAMLDRAGIGFRRWGVNHSNIRIDIHDKDDIPAAAAPAVVGWAWFDCEGKLLRMMRA